VAIIIYAKFFGSRCFSSFLALLVIQVPWAAVQTGCSDQKRIERVKVDHLQSVSASSCHPSFPPALLLDAGSGPGKAWHSTSRPAFPQWIQVEYPEPVVLDKMALQAQYDARGGRTNNLLRAPRRVEVWAANNSPFRPYERIAAWECRYRKAGDWCLKEVPAASRKYAFYRLVILDNYGDPEYVTIQEMNFFSHE
jgi:hypothetical protein